MLACYVFVCERAWLHVCVPVHAGLFLDVFVCLCVSPPLSVYALGCVCAYVFVYSVLCLIWSTLHGNGSESMVVRMFFSVSIMGHAGPPRMFCHWGRRLDRFRSAEIDPGGGGTFEARLGPAEPL